MTRDEWRRAHPERVRQIQLKSYLKHRPRRRAEDKAGRLADRKLVLEFYGNKCVCCGETITEFLTLDHKNNDGAKHRRENKIKNIYTWLRREFPDGDFPDCFQILCYNCNCAKGHYGRCPHERSVVSEEA